VNFCEDGRQADAVTLEAEANDSDDFDPTFGVDDDQGASGIALS
jgi:hypothetical protein